MHPCDTCQDYAGTYLRCALQPKGPVEGHCPHYSPGQRGEAVGHITSTDDRWSRVEGAGVAAEVVVETGAIAPGWGRWGLLRRGRIIGGGDD